MTSGPRPRLLLLDDDEQILMNLSAYLVDEGYPVSAAADGPSALALLRALPHEAALVDLRLPGMDGIRFMAEARRLDPDIVFLVVTGSPDHACPGDLIAHGVCARHVIRKPIRDMSEITSAVQSVLQEVS